MLGALSLGMGPSGIRTPESALHFHLMLMLGRALGTGSTCSSGGHCLFCARGAQATPEHQRGPILPAGSRVESFQVISESSLSRLAWSSVSVDIKMDDQTTAINLTRTTPDKRSAWTPNKPTFRIDESVSGCRHDQHLLHGNEHTPGTPSWSVCP